MTNLQQRLSAGTVHFVGLGGIGMSAIALILNKMGVRVQGSDLTENYIAKSLRDKQIRYFVGHKKENITSDVNLVVKTSIIKKDNPEIVFAEEKNIPIITRAELLAMIMKEKKGVTIAGTHGKTSTTAMTALMLELAGLDPTVINGGIINYFNSNSKLGDGKYLIAESDESDGSFVYLPTFIGAVTNIEPEHLEFYDNDFEKQKTYFEKYITQIPDEGLCMLCLDDFETAKIYSKIKPYKNNVITYSIKSETCAADLVAKNIVVDADGCSFDAIFTKKNYEIKNIKMQVYGLHNISNSLVAVGIADFLAISPDDIKKALASFSGVKRRFTKVGEVGGITIIDDYGHHPTEIKTTLLAARQLVSKGKIISIFEPHKYTRLKHLFREFCEAFEYADIIVVTKIYPAGQQPIDGITQDALVEGIKNAAKNKLVIKLENEKDLAKIIRENALDGDLVLCTGAGNITYLAAKLEGEIKELYVKS
jgi:UDP-N-acetylmuramate--alanine ligase